MDSSGSSSKMMDMDFAPRPHPDQLQDPEEKVDLKGKGVIPLPELLRSHLRLPNDRHKAAVHSRDVRLKKLRRSRQLARKRARANSTRLVEDANSGSGEDSVVDDDEDRQSCGMVRNPSKSTHVSQVQDDMDQPMADSELPSDSGSSPSRLQPSDPGPSTSPLHRPWMAMIRRAKEEQRQRRLAESRGSWSQRDDAAVMRRFQEFRRRRQSRVLSAARAQARLEAAHDQIHSNAEMDCLPDALGDLSLAQMDGASDEAPLRGTPQR